MQPNQLSTFRFYIFGFSMNYQSFLPPVGPASRGSYNLSRCWFGEEVSASEIQGLAWSWQAWPSTGLFLFWGKQKHDTTDCMRQLTWGGHVTSTTHAFKKLTHIWRSEDRFWGPLLLPCGYWGWNLGCLAVIPIKLWKFGVCSTLTVF